MHTQNNLIVGRIFLKPHAQAFTRSLINTPLLCKYFLLLDCCFFALHSIFRFHTTSRLFSFQYSFSAANPTTNHLSSFLSLYLNCFTSYFIKL